MVGLFRIPRFHAFRLACFMALAAMTGVTAQAETLLSTDARYPRIRMLPGGELIASILSSPRDFNVKIYASSDNGASFMQVGTIEDPEFQPLHSSSPNIFRMPRTVGTLAQGTLILGLNVDTTRCETCRSKIKIYKSIDNGRNWSFVTVAAQAMTKQGLWEPDFSIAADGALVLHYADETSSCCDQKLVRRRTRDGLHWENQTDTVALSATHALRPGMPMVSKLRSGSFLLTYEVCGQAEATNCRTYYKTSVDGWNYGASDTIGTPMQDQAGRYFTNTPVAQVLPDGTLLWTGQYLRAAGGAAAEDNGRVIFKSASGNPDGPWTTIPAPVTLPRPVFHGCEGFSPGLQPLANGAMLVELTTRRNASSGNCDMYFATGPTH